MRRKFLSALLAIAIALPGNGATADCIKGFMTGLDEYDAGQRKGKRTFKINELLVLCFEVEQSGFVAIYDSPALGDFEQLYPNALTHRNDESFTSVEAGKTYCFGQRGTFPLYHPKSEGTGEGKVSIVLTSSPDDQVPAEDFDIPGQRVRASVMHRQLGVHKESKGPCTAREVRYIHYEVRK